MNTIPRNRARWTFAVGVTLLVLCAGATGILLVQIHEHNRRVMHAFTIQLSLQDLESSLAAAGRARSLYSFSRSPKDFDAANTSIADAEKLIQNVVAQSSSIPAHHDSYTTIGVLSERRLAILRAALRDAQAGKTDAATQDGYTVQIIPVADQLKANLQQLETHEQAFATQGLILSERLFTAAVVVLASAFLFALGLLYLNFRFLLTELVERRRAEKSALDSEETLRLLSIRLLRLQDEQSRKFSRELHDGLGQYLSLAKMNLSRFLRTSAPNPLLSESVDLLDRSIAESRTISYLLHPPLLDDMGFLFAARWYLEGFSERSGIQVSSDLPQEPVRLPLPVELALFRVLQECLANIHRHSGSKRAEVSLSFTTKEAILIVRDYGHGIPADVLAQFRATGGRVGVGLAGMRERVREQNGMIDIESDSRGTVVLVRLPVTIAAPTASPQLTT